MPLRPAAALLGLLPLVCVSAPAGAEPASQTIRHRVVLELTTDATASWEGVLNNLENARQALGPDRTTLELVVHGPAIGFVLPAHQRGAKRMQALADQGVIFAACRNSMNRKKLTDSDLLPFVKVVPAGVAEVVLKQEDGWSYLKSGH